MQFIILNYDAKFSWGGGGPGMTRDHYEKRVGTIMFSQDDQYLDWNPSPIFLRLLKECPLNWEIKESL